MNKNDKKYGNKHKEMMLEI